VPVVHKAFRALGRSYALPAHQQAIAQVTITVIQHILTKHGLVLLPDQLRRRTPNSHREPSRNTVTDTSVGYLNTGPSISHRGQLRITVTPTSRSTHTHADLPGL
jgi:hypothetical protein